LRSHLYSASEPKSRQVTVPTRCITHMSAVCYPFTESVFEGTILQPYIHDCVVRVQEGPHISRFRIFFKCHCWLPVNQTLLKGKNIAFRRDTVV
ncbi:hypothetical protein K439DRAFT_1261803, partial [Ramaria rubella]